MNSAEHAKPIPRTAVEGRILLGILVFTAVSVAGFASFGQHPELLAALPRPLMSFYGLAFSLFAQAQVWIATAALMFVLWRRTGFLWIPAFATLYIISLSVELAGTRFGVPFGDYSYGPLLGKMWFGSVPITIPLSWFFMAIPSFVLASRATSSRPKRVLLASLLLLSWDLALDPAMSFVTQYWFWGATGPYYGMPTLNLLGWYVTGLMLMGALELLRAERWTRVLPHAWMARFYSLNLLLPVAMCAVAGAWLAVVATIGMLGIVAAVLALRGVSLDLLPARSAEV